jgi:ferrous iron transport protein A
LERAALRSSADELREESEGATGFDSFTPGCAFFCARKEDMLMTLDQLKPGSEGRIKRLSATDKLGQRLLDMGVYPGLKLRVLRNAPLDDPMEVELEGYFVSLRHEEARFVEVE